MFRTCDYFILTVLYLDLRGIRVLYYDGCIIFGLWVSCFVFLTVLCLDLRGGGMFCTYNCIIFGLKRVPCFVL